METDQSKDTLITREASFTISEKTFEDSDHKAHEELPSDMKNVAYPIEMMHEQEQRCLARNEDLRVVNPKDLFLRENKKNTQMYTHEGELFEFKNDKFEIGYKVHTNLGQSGSPILVKGSKEGEYSVIGVHSRSGGIGKDANYGVLLNSARLKIEAWIRQATKGRGSVPARTSTSQKVLETPKNSEKPKEKFSCFLSYQDLSQACKQSLNTKLDGKGEDQWSSLNSQGKLELLNSHDLTSESYSYLVVEFKQYLSEMTQIRRYELTKETGSHLSTEEFWILSSNLHLEWIQKMQAFKSKKF